jgi:hypothetical protein
VRERLIGERTALVHAVHGLQQAYGMVMPKGVAKFRQAVVGKLGGRKGPAHSPEPGDGLEVG